MFFTPEQIKKYEGDLMKVEVVLKELPKTSYARKEIIKERFGGFDIYMCFLMSQLTVGFEHNENLKKAYLACTDKHYIVAMVGVCTETGYIIAEERYEQQIKMLKAKLMIAESEIEQLKQKEETCGGKQ